MRERRAFPLESRTTFSSLRYHARRQPSEADVEAGGVEGESIPGWVSEKQRSATPDELVFMEISLRRPLSLSPASPLAEC